MKWVAMKNLKSFGFGVWIFWLSWCGWGGASWIRAAGKHPTLPNLTKHRGTSGTISKVWVKVFHVAHSGLRSRNTIWVLKQTSLLSADLVTNKIVCAIVEKTWKISSCEAAGEITHCVYRISAIRARINWLFYKGGKPKMRNLWLRSKLRFLLQ